METGRNAPCPCGSGRKYKKCCLKTLEPDRDQDWRRLNEAYGVLHRRLLAFAGREFGRRGVEAGWSEFLCWPVDESDPELLDRLDPLIGSWFVFNWVYEPDPFGEPLRVPEGITPAELLLKKAKDGLSETDRELIGAISRKSFSFYEVLRCEPGRGFLLKDILLGNEIDVLERGTSSVAREGDILFGRVATVRGLTMLFGSSSHIIPPELKPRLIDLRQWIHHDVRKGAKDVLHECDIEIREVFLEISQTLFRRPEIRNTDDEPVSMRTLHYDIDSPNRAFSALAGLCATKTEKKLRESAETDSRGGIVRVEIPWSRKGFRNQPLESTVLGILTIEGKKLRADVNSAKRAERVGEEIERRLGSGAKYRTTVIASMGALEREFREKGPRPYTEKENELMNLPEVRQQLAEMIRAHWDRWVDEEIPALGGKTPRQAATTAEGREGVAALLRSAERMAERNGHMQEATVVAVAEVRKKLNLSGATQGVKPAPARD